MADETEPASLAGTSSGYITKNTIFVQAAAGQVRLLLADPRRWYVRFDRGGIVTNLFYVLPAPIPAGFNPTQQATFPIEYKFRDCPSMVSGEWYGAFASANTVIITECLYVGN